MQALTTDDIASLTTAQVHALTTVEISALSTDQVHALSTADMFSLSTDQLHAFTTANIAALTTDQVYALTTTDLASLSTDQVNAMTTSDIVALHNAPSDKTNAFTATQIQNMSDPLLNAAYHSPIVLDLGGTGIHTVGAAAGQSFDLTGTGVSQKVGWITGNSGFLVRDLNHDGIINNGTEMFGTATKLANGTTAKDGFAALQALDTNHDGVINAKDAAFSELKVWVDGNQDGISQAGELHSLQSLGIVDLNLNASHTAINNNGNWIVLDSTYTTADGKVHEMGDVWFQTATLTTADIAAMSTQQVHALSTDQLHAFSTNQLHAMSTDQLHALTTDQLHVLGSDQIHALSTDQIHALTSDQIHALSTDQMHALTHDQVHALTTADVMALSTVQLHALTADDMAALQNMVKVEDVSALHSHGALDHLFSNSGIQDVFSAGTPDAAAGAHPGVEHAHALASGTAPDAAAHADHHGSAGSLLVNGAEHHAHIDAHTQIAIQGVPTEVKDPLLG